MDNHEEKEGRKQVNGREMLDARLCISENVTRQARRLLYCESPQELLNTLRAIASTVSYESRSVRNKFFGALKE